MGGLGASVRRLVYHRRMIPTQERLVQLARLAGVDMFSQRFGPPQTASPDAAALASLVGERLDQIAQGLIEEAAASDDVIDAASAQAYLDDRLRTLGGLLTSEHSAAIRVAFQTATDDW